jgi:hypothetical protein
LVIARKITQPTPMNHAPNQSSPLPTIPITPCTEPTPDPAGGGHVSGTTPEDGSPGSATHFAKCLKCGKPIAQKYIFTLAKDDDGKIAKKVTKGDWKHL